MIKFLSAMLASFVGGFVLHKTTYRPSLSLPDKFGNLFRYTLGCVFLVPFYIIMVHALDNRRDDISLIVDAFLVGFSNGAGVLFGYLWDNEK